MKLSARLERLEMAYSKKESGFNPYEETLYQEFEDWVREDPKAKELIEREYKYCIEKGYPPNDMDHFDELEDPVFWGMVRETLDAFDKYLRRRLSV